MIESVLSALAAEATHAMPEPIGRISHRWRYARARAPHRGALWHETTQIGAIEDLLVEPMLESGWLAGRELAERIIATHLSSG